MYCGLFRITREGVYMNKPMNFIYLTDEKLSELGSLCPVSNNSDKTFTDLDFDVSMTIPCLEQPALKHIVLCVEGTTLYEINAYHNVRMTKDIWDSGILISKSFNKTNISNEPAEYSDGKIIGQHWLAIEPSCLHGDRKLKLPTIHVRPSVSSPGYIDIIMPQEETDGYIYRQLTNNDTSDDKVYDAIFDYFVNYIVVNRVLLSNGGKYHKTGSKVPEISVLSMVKRTLPRKVSLKNITIDTDAFVVDYQPKKHDGTSDNTVKIWHCPAWEVRGHYRHYKNGKVTYVKPHAKGKLRNTLVTGREYDLSVR